MICVIGLPPILDHQAPSNQQRRSGMSPSHQYEKARKEKIKDERKKRPFLSHDEWAKVRHFSCFGGVHPIAIFNPP